MNKLLEIHDNAALKHLNKIAKQIYLGDGMWIAGGYVRKVLFNEDRQCDIDVFYNTKKTFQQHTAKLETIQKYPRETSAHVTFGIGGQPVQCICMQFYKDLYSVLDGFDFTICQFGYDGDKIYTFPSKADSLIKSSLTQSDVNSKTLRVHNIKYPVSFVNRVIKHCKMGYNIDKDQIMKFIQYIARNSDKMDFSNTYGNG